MWTRVKMWNKKSLRDEWRSFYPASFLVIVFCKDRDFNLFCYRPNCDLSWSINGPQSVHFMP